MTETRPPLANLDDSLAATREQAAQALARAPGQIAALIRRAPTSYALACALHDIAAATNRESVRWHAGYFTGTAVSTWSAMLGAAGEWSHEELSAVTDYGRLMETRTLLALPD